MSSYIITGSADNKELAKVLLFKKSVNIFQTKLNYHLK